MDLKLERQDYEILIEALDAWAKRDIFSSLMGDMLTSILCKTDEEKAEVLRMKKEKEEIKKAERKRDEEITVLLKSKLILMRG